jgi:6-phosphogluconolactonase
VDLRIFDSPDSLAEAASDIVEASAREAIGARGSFSLVLAGGSTPRILYGLLAARSRLIDWPSVRVFFGDERCVPPDDPASNYRMAEETLLARVRPAAVHRIVGEFAPQAAADRYEKEIRDAFAPHPPRFDLVLLGMGADGHTASLFPGQEPEEPGRLAVPARSPAAPHDRVTLTSRALTAARGVLFLVSGIAKAKAFARVVAGIRGDGPADLPAARVRPEDGRLRWFVDRAAAAELPEGAR